MTEQLLLIDGNDSSFDHDRFVLDAHTRRVGLAGLAKARAALAGAVRDREQLHGLAA